MKKFASKTLCVFVIFSMVFCGCIATAFAAEVSSWGNLIYSRITTGYDFIWNNNNTIYSHLGDK